MPGGKSFLAVLFPGKLQAKLWNFFFFCDFQKGNACCFILCGVRRGERGDGILLSKGKWIQGSNPQEAVPGGGLVCLGADGKGNQGEVDSSKQSAGSGAWGWVSPAGAGGNPPNFRSPPRGGFEKGNFSLYLFLFFLSVLWQFFFKHQKELPETLLSQSNVNRCFHSLLLILFPKKYFSLPSFYTTPNPVRGTNRLTHQPP